MNVMEIALWCISNDQNSFYHAQSEIAVEENNISVLRLYSNAKRFPLQSGEGKFRIPLRTSRVILISVLLFLKYLADGLDDGVGGLDGDQRFRLLQFVFG